MKDFFNRWLSNNGRIPGILACGLHYPDHTVFSLSSNPAYPVPVLDPVWRCLSDTFQVYNHNRLPYGVVRWVYKNAHLYAGIRQDGVCVGFFVAADAHREVHESVRQIVSEFISMKIVG